MTARYATFRPETLAFLRELSRNNNRDWFNRNKSRYEELVLTDALEFIRSMQAPLAEIAPYFVARPKRVGGSLMRVYRDTRFARDKSPYKTNIGIQFRHERARDVHAPGYYLHIDPDQVFVGVGMWRPDSKPLGQIRDRIVEKPDEWRRAVGGKTFRRRFELEGESLKRAPRGFDESHELISDIKRKSFIAVRRWEPDACLKPRFQQTVETTVREGAPFMAFVCRAVGVAF